uniref:hypothetical protein n=1 Tax=Ningiella ruwaisensis TaxID=2364274 RepID=UPI0010A024D3|nr:hypothetical protein [Ningiella ruwaisensis]
MKYYKPNDYAKEIYGGAVSGATIRNWAKSGKLKHRVELTPTGQYLIFVDEQLTSEADKLLKMIKAA